ncbi:hypothetical protein BCR43DRAFT_562162 [Syncephalastrum racemosum]|uniref:Uncharacterized protein n=1 Tax=Syncephalastrum racemosum TaxID=13706 RepID=A0A1X2HI53_SYNRA|nr:hypothetical protein BCR43DRAFT_562162 [Syncephalastrum racemosum]
MDLSAITSPPYVHRPQPYHPKPVESHRLDHHHTRHESRSSAFHPVASIPSPPELLHDSDEETMSSSSPSEHSSALSARPAYFSASHKRKSIPHRSPAAVRDAFQASAVDKSVVFQLDVRSQPFFLKPSRHEQQQQQTSEIACTSRVICGESLLTALRTRVAEARTHHHRRHQTFKQQRSARKTTHIELRRHHHQQPAYRHQDNKYENISPPTSPMSSPQQLPHHTMPTAHAPIMTSTTSTAQPNSPTMSFSPQTSPEIVALVAPAPPSLSSLPSPRHKTEKQLHHQQQQSIPQQQTTVVHHASSGRPSRVKGPCQACQESSDGCMRKAFNWPFPTSSIYNDKGRPFVYLCNKCGLRYNKSGGCVCRHCRWVFCKEEKRKAMQYIDQMRRSRPDGRVDPDEEIENFVCTPKYWTCGRPWKVGWVLQTEDDVEDMHD